MSSSARPGARRARVLATASVLLSFGASLATVELGLRLWRGRLTPYLFEDLQMTGGLYPAVHDELLGYRPGQPEAGGGDPWGVPITLDADGIRVHPSTAARRGPPILAVGDSFTFGDEVGDSDTWPAALGRRLGRRVINGGVFGYGLDQVVLRSEELSERFAPAALIVNIIPDDVRRCEYSYRFSHKPYFELDGERLLLRNVPVPAPATPPPGETGFRRALRRSFLGEFVLHRLDPLGWLMRGSVRVHRRGEEVAAALVDRLADRATALGYDLLLVAAWHPGARAELLDPALARARERGVEVLDLQPLIRAEIAQNGGDWSALYTEREREGAKQAGHMTPLGNERVAAAIAARLASATSLASHAPPARPRRAAGPARSAFSP